jgi:hypothetical protein
MTNLLPGDTDPALEADLLAGEAISTEFLTPHRTKVLYYISTISLLANSPT